MLNIKSFLLLLGISIVFSGCVNKTITPLTPKSSKNLSGKTFTIIKRDLPTLPQIITPTAALSASMLGGLTGALVNFTDDSKTTVDKAFSNTPSSYIYTNIAMTLEEKYKMKFVNIEKITNEFDINNLPKEYENIDYIIDHKDIGWLVNYYPMHWFSYGIYYSGKLKIYDVSSKKVVAEGYCHYSPTYDTNSPSYDELFENNNQKLMEITKVALDQCIKTHLEKVY